ncbi:MAG: SUMF1/EgtB/PvdO family nonheme iron enzyme [Magnetococcales bacterium]|nr:SUMF1/EgtB/PvdO family nonheme iron enzyme [Magnetococcales bacterium]
MTKSSQSIWKLPVSLYDLILPVIFLLALALGWSLLSYIHPSATTNPSPTLPWQACLDNQSRITLVEIPAGTYPVPDPTSSLGPLMHFKESTLEINNPFLLQNREVDLEQFKRYVEDVDRMQNFSEKERLRLRLGKHWELNDAQDNLVRHVSWEGAMDYAQWLSQKTGCAYTLPSREEWAAAVIHASSYGPKVMNGSISAEGLATNLLRVVQEWSRSPCPEGYFLLGSDSSSTVTEESKEVCMPAQLAVAGFRLVLHMAPPGAKSENTAKTGEFLKMDSGLSLGKTTNPP